MEISYFGFYPNRQRNEGKKVTSTFTPLNIALAAYILIKLKTTE